MINECKIESIEVEQLFGLYNYKLESNLDTDFLILYGDNGSGKSSILSIIYHALHPEPKGGHRTAISKIPFMRFVIHFSNEIKIEIRRESLKLKDYYISIPNKKIEYKWSEERDFDPYERIENEQAYNSYCSFLEELNFNTLYMSADRKIYSGEENEVYMLGNEVIRRKGIERKGDSLSEVIISFNRWMHKCVIQSTDVGNKNLTTHYLNIIDKMSKRKSDKVVSLETVKKRIKLLEKKSDEYIKYGLTVELFSEDLKNKIQNISPTDWTTIYPIIDSYMSTIDLRLSALDALQKKLKIFDNYINNFFKDKKICINAINGLSIVSTTGDPLYPEQLSSGEKQILYLFCKVLTATEKSLIVIIDEPEISLNIKWQRQFLNAINSFMLNNRAQVIIASHSVAMINPFISSVAKLESK